VTNCYFANATGWESLRLRQGGDGHVITNNSFINGTDNVSICHGKNHLVENNYFDTADHTCMVFLGCEDSVFRYNTLVNPDMKLMEVFGNRWSPDVGKPPRHIFITDNHFKYTGDYPRSGSSAVAMNFTGEYNVVRRNLVTDCQAGFLFSQSLQSDGEEAEWNRHNRMYHNVIYDMGQGGTAWKYNGLGLVFGAQGTNGYGDNIIVNNIIYKGYHTDGRWFVGFPSTTIVGFHSGSGPEDILLYNNNIYNGTAPNPVVFADIHDGYHRSFTVATYEAAFPAYCGGNISVNPQMVDPDNYDAKLQPGSPCIDTGRPLTSTVSSGSGTSVQLADATYFTDGFGIVEPDEIQIGAERVTIVSVDYSTNVVTIDRSISWAAGAPVSLPWNGSAPDMGIHEFQTSSVVGRYVFYNNSAFDGADPAANAADDAAIATDKQALLPGQTASFANYTSYWRGINGVMVDIQNLPGTPTVLDLLYNVGNDNNPDGWACASTPISVTVRPGAGVGGSDRVTILWNDGAIVNTWLRVTIKATANTGLAEPDVFYFGNAIGETGNSPSDAKVTPTDAIGCRNNPHTSQNPAGITDAYDFDRDTHVGPTDEIICRDNGTNSMTALCLITVP